MTKFNEKEVVEMKNKGKLFHVSNIWRKRPTLTEDEKILYEVWDLTHTEREYWRKEDLEDQFHSTGIKCDGKPSSQISFLNHRMEE